MMFPLIPAWPLQRYILCHIEVKSKALDQRIDLKTTHEEAIRIENRIREIVESRNIQFGFRRGSMSTTEPIFAMRIIQEKYQERKKDIHMVFVDLEKAYELLLLCLHEPVLLYCLLC